MKKWHYLKNPLRNWYIEDISKVVETCVIMHNMIVDERRGALTENVEASDESFRRLVRESEEEEAAQAEAQGQGQGRVQSAYEVESFSFLGQLEQNLKQDLEACTSRVDITMAISTRIDTFINHTENPHISHALRMALVEHIWDKKKRCKKKRD